MLVATSIAGAAPAQKPRWQLIPGVRSDFGEGNVVLGWASDRAWIAATSARGMAVTSVGVSGGTLRAFKTTSIAAGLWTRLVVESELVYWVELADGKGRLLQTRQLLANGGLGAPSAVPLELDQIARRHSIGPEAAVRLGDRTIWALPGGTRAFSPKGVLWVCCATDGSARELTRFIDRASPPNPVRLGLDERGRLWLAWHDRCCVKIMELDPSSLLPRTTKPVVAPGVAVERFELVCTAVCRLVIEDLYRKRIHSWAPGERSPTMIVRPVPGINRAPKLLAAAPRSADLLVGYEPPDTSGVQVVRGDGRGARSRLVATSKEPSLFMTHAVFVPAGLVAVAPKGALCEICPVRIGLLRVAR